MALKSTSSPLAQMELSAWRTQVCAYKGINYSSMPSAWQTMFDDTVNRAIDYISQRAAHQPWGQQETTLTVTSGADTTYSMPAAFRHLIAIYEVAADGSRVKANYTSKQTFYEKQSGSAHPWESSTDPYWFWDGMTDGEPPVQQWRRVGADNSGATVYVLFRPFFNLLTADGGTQDDWPYLPASESEAVLWKILEAIEVFSQNWEAAGVLRSMKEDAIHALEVGDRKTVEAPMRQDVDPDFARQMG